MDFTPFGTIQHKWCGCCGKQTNQVLGQDDEWYCQICDNHYYYKIAEYNKQEACELCGAAIVNDECTDPSGTCEYNELRMGIPGGDK